MIINYVKDDIPQNVKNIIQKYLETVNTYNDRIPQQNADVCEQLKKLSRSYLNKYDKRITGNQRKNLIKEIDSLKLLNTIFLQKDLKKVSVATWTILCCLIFFIIPLIIFFFNKISISFDYVRNLFSDLLTILSILIGFSITALSMVGLGLSKETLLLTSKHESSFYKGVSIYKETIFVFLEYLYSLLSSLLYIIIAQFILPFIYKAKLRKKTIKAVKEHFNINDIDLIEKELLELGEIKEVPIQKK